MKEITVQEVQAAYEWLAGQPLQPSPIFEEMAQDMNAKERAWDELQTVPSYVSRDKSAESGFAREQ